MNIYRALTIAGSDSGGGAGIQADLKTFAAFGVHGMTAITAITAQNTVDVLDIFVLPPKIVELQIDAVASDIGVDAAKTGMLYNKEIIETVSRKIDEYNLKIIVDPVMIAKSGVKLLLDEAIRALKYSLIPKALIVTPNISEAEVLTGLKIRNIDDMKKAAEEICDLGVEAVVIKGGHLEGKYEVIDILYYKRKFYEIRKERVESRCTHGTGCTFSAAITALIARGKSIPEAVEMASKFMNRAIKFGIRVGEGHGPVNPMIELYRKSSKYECWNRVHEALKIIENTHEISKLIPEVRMNIGEAIENAENENDVCAIDGRISIVNGRPRAVGCPVFGASSHVARIILTVMKFNSKFRAAANMRYSRKIIEICKELGYRVAFFDRGKEPEHVKKIEGASLPWGISKAINDYGDIPDIIYDLGDVGKEPMIRVLGKNSVEVANKIRRIAKKLVKI
ncbi:MAG: bifunctional hydroxymethylpyrimidine kinase/phosphomethylpyrimidine kinase [Candidatus Methanomethylicota archaeon]|uniref:Bifunctional thiamine biosynthesis protein ThiDN n=1 Tax=Thermoproteota archaeon TaxID=2056631 RepID=A0A497EV55_9CREN|nr:MAG: bifunctional hydroxymethylpyrimidine kinase/phosphomethylpyrimidine kinase [Candidatus Verstraetearchaeota archaeon]